MLQCFCLRSGTSTTSNLRSSSPTPRGISENSTPRSSALRSPTVNLSQEYARAVQTSSYSAIWFKIHPINCSSPDIYTGELEKYDEQQLLEEVLQPNQECVQEALRSARSGILKDLVSAYFDHSEHSSRFFLHLHHNVHRVHNLYASLHDILNLLPPDSNAFTQLQCDQAFDAFLQFDSCKNLLPCSDSLCFDDMNLCLSQLRQQLDDRLHKSCCRVLFLQKATTSSGPFLSMLLPSRLTKRELAHLAQIDAASKGTYVLQNDLDTVDCLVTRLHNTVESDKFLVHLGLERARDKHSIQEVVNQLRKNYQNLLLRLADLEEHLCLCFAAINRARSLLHEEICLHQS